MFLLIQHEQQEGRPMGERSQRTLFQPAFNRGVRVERGSTDLTGDTGVIVAREAMEQLGLPGAFRGLADPRNQAQIRFPFVDLVMTRVAMLAELFGARAWSYRRSSGGDASNAEMGRAR